jgi:hypothetical protein
VGRMRVDSGAVQCHVFTRARVGACVGSHPRPAIHMRKKEASRCKVPRAGGQVQAPNLTRAGEGGLQMRRC